MAELCLPASPRKFRGSELRLWDTVLSFLEGKVGSRTNITTGSRCSSQAASWPPPVEKTVEDMWRKASKFKNRESKHAWVCLLPENSFYGLPRNFSCCRCKYFSNSGSLKYEFCKRGFKSNIWELKAEDGNVSGGRRPRRAARRQKRASPCRQAHGRVQTSRPGQMAAFGCPPQTLSENDRCGKGTQRCQTTGNYPKSLSAQSTVIFIVLWQIYTWSGTPGLARRPDLTNCQGIGAVICLRRGFLPSLLKTCGFTFPLSLQEMAGQWNAE